MWFLTDGIKKIRFPIKYEMIPPMYDIVASINKNNHGVTDFDAHPINTSGGINPNKVSEIKKNEKIICGEYVSTRLIRNVLISITNNSIPKIINTKTTTDTSAFKAVSFRNG
jgi:hypothetical protein